MNFQANAGGSKGLLELAPTVSKLKNRQSNSRTSALGKLPREILSGPIRQYLSQNEIKSLGSANKDIRSSLRQHVRTLRVKEGYPSVSEVLANYDKLNQIKTLNLCECNVSKVDFSRFSNLENVNLSYAKNLSPDQINQLPTTIKSLDLGPFIVAGIDFSRFSRLIR